MNSSASPRSGSHAVQHLRPAVQSLHGRAQQAQPQQQQQGGGGGKGGSPAPAPVIAATPPPPPTIEDTSAQAQDEGDKLRRRQGALATNVTGPQGADTPATSGKTLLGA